MKNIVPKSKSECCGCTACVSVCPVGAISIQNDKEGFAYPSINEEKCIKCGLCYKSCAFVNREPLPSVIDTAYVAKHKNLEARMGSRSGAVFVACSDWILENGGVVYGCILDENLHACHIRAEDKATRDLMCKSKYVQSDMTGVIPQIIDDLSNGRKVLYSGTGCQVEGVLSVLKTKKMDCSNFYTVDIVCHGAASPMIFEDYIDWLEKKYKGKVTAFDFRDKSQCGWDGHIESYTMNGKKHAGVTYREIFHTDLCIRPSCYNCKYCVVDRNSDLTIADAWGIKTALPSFNDNRGVSMFLVQSQKGQELLECIKNNCEVAELPLQKMMQGNLQRPSKMKGNRDEFWKIYNEEGIGSVVKKYGKYPLKKRAKAFVKYKVRKLTQSGKYYLP